VVLAFLDIAQRSLLTLPTFQDSISAPTSSIQEDGADWLSRNVGNHQPPLRNIQKREEDLIYIATAASSHAPMPSIHDILLSEYIAK
jgi:hypothetical protein